MEVIKNNLSALCYRCKTTIIYDLVELKISPNYSIWRNKNMLCKIQSFLIEPQHSYSNRVIYLLTGHVLCEEIQITKDK